MKYNVKILNKNVKKLSQLHKYGLIYYQFKKYFKFNFLKVLEPI